MNNPIIFIISLLIMLASFFSFMIGKKVTHIKYINGKCYIIERTITETGKNTIKENDYRCDK